MPLPEGWDLCTEAMQCFLFPMRVSTFVHWLLLQNVELIASLREIMEVQALANENSAGSCQGIVTGNQDSSLVEESSIQSSPKVMHTVWLCDNS